MRSLEGIIAANEKAYQEQRTDKTDTQVTKKIRQDFSVCFPNGDCERMIFEFPNEEAFEAALKLFSWATGFFVQDSFFTSKKAGGLNPICKPTKTISKRRSQIYPPRGEV